MDAFQQMLNVVGNNIANENTTAFKASNVEFSDIMNQTLNLGSAGQGTATAPGNPGGTNPQQVGLGVQVSQIYKDFTQGAMNITGNPNNLAISGNGFFLVSTNPAPTKMSDLYFTRAGDFSVDSNGNLVTPNGYYLLGIKGTTAPTLSTQATGTGDPSITLNSLTSINVNNTSNVASSFSVGTNGIVTVTGGNTYYIPLATVENPNGLLDVGNNLYAPNSYSNPVEGTITYDVANDTTNGVGSITQGALEASNVDLTKEMSNMIVAQTGYEANSKVINTVNQMNQFMIQQV